MVSKLIRSKFLFLSLIFLKPVIHFDLSVCREVDFLKKPSMELSKDVKDPLLVIISTLDPLARVL